MPLFGLDALAKNGVSFDLEINASLHLQIPGSEFL
jgi:hypothetical protein